MHLRVKRSKKAEGSICVLDFKYRCSLENKLIPRMYAHLLTVLNGSHKNLLKVVKFHVHYNIKNYLLYQLMDQETVEPASIIHETVEPASHTALFKEN